jgi:riboflavin biosynthesis pyrimidine reductase
LSEHQEFVMVRSKWRAAKLAPAVKLAPLETLFESSRDHALPLPGRLARLYGTFRMSTPRSGFRIFSNFVSTLDGVVSLQARGHSGGGDISGFSGQDRMVMGLLRAAADVIIVGSGTLEADPQHVWTPEVICPELADEYRRLERNLGKSSASLNVVVSGRGALNLRLPVFASGRVPALIVTTTAGAKQLLKQQIPDSVRIHAIRGRAEIPAAAILEAVARVGGGKRILVEGGPRLLGSFYNERLIDEQFLSLAPQLSGREFGDARMSLVMGKLFAPRNPRWGKLIDVRRGSKLLFLRYGFGSSSASA